MVYDMDRQQVKAHFTKRRKVFDTAIDFTPSDWR